MIFTVQLPQFYREYQLFFDNHGSMAIVVRFLKNIYYFVEAMIVVLLLALMQRAGELIFKVGNFPYGGIGLLLTWGMVHLTKGLVTGLWISGFCIVLGWLFLKVKKRFWPSLLFVGFYS